MKAKLTDSLLAKYFSAESLTDDESHLIRQWKERNPSEYWALKKILENKEQAVYFPDEEITFDVDKAWYRVESRRNKTRAKFTWRRSWNRVAVAASVCLLAVSSYLLVSNYNPTQVVTTAKGETSKTVLLADGTNVRLNENSSLTYKKRMKSVRRVKLQGEAFFDVARDEENPFVIEASLAEIKVLGTSFNVKTDTKKTTVSVRTGKVELKNDGRIIMLNAGEQGVSSVGKMEKHLLHDENYLAWKNKKLSFRSAELKDVVLALEDYYNTEIEIVGDASSCLVNTTFTSETLIEALDELKVLLHFEYTKNADGKIKIYDIKCN